MQSCMYANPMQPNNKVIFLYFMGFYIIIMHLQVTEDALKSEVGLDDEEFVDSRGIATSEAIPDINSLLAEYEK